MVVESTLCWDCRCSTTKECSWARRFKPVKGWVVTEKLVKNAHNATNGETKSYIVHECPDFIRDSWGGGRYRTKEEYLTRTRKRETL